MRSSWTAISTWRASDRSRGWATWTTAWSTPSSRCIACPRNKAFFGESSPPPPPLLPGQTMDLEQFRLDIADGIATVTFDRPPVNAQNRRTRDELIRIFDEISDRDDIRVAILTGAGNMFSAGADLKERVDLVHEPGDYVRHNRLVREFFYAVTDCTKPVIAAGNGPAIGAGFVLMLACDIMIASDNAYFSMPEINVGLAGGARFLMEHVGRSRTRSMYLTGRRVPAAELYRLGVIEACPPREKLMEAAL